MNIEHYHYMNRTLSAATSKEMQCIVMQCKKEQLKTNIMINTKIYKI